eukprot:6848098-Pyramimonas_sp.AAC.1
MLVIRAGHANILPSVAHEHPNWANREEVSGGASFRGPFVMLIIRAGHRNTRQGIALERPKGAS